MGAQSERLSYEIRRGLLAHEEQSCVGDKPADLFSDLESMHPRQVDIEQNHIRVQIDGLLNGLQPVHCLDDLKLCSSLQLRTNDLAELRMVFDDENPHGHMALSSMLAKPTRPSGRERVRHDPMPRTNYAVSLLRIEGSLSKSIRAATLSRLLAALHSDLISVVRNY
jgi:hypothetical protein